VTSAARTDAEHQFEAMLRVFDEEVAHIPGRFLCADLTMRALALEDADVLGGLNRDADFWVLVSHALHATTFITLHRLFNRNSVGNTHALLKFATQHPEMFSKARFQARNDGESPEWLSAAHEASSEDFRTLRREVARRRKVYDNVYLPIRGKIIAHRIYIGAEERERYAATRIDELLELCSFFPAFHEALFRWYRVGARPEVNVERLSFDDVRKRRGGDALARLVVKHTEHAMKVIARASAAKRAR
jgi:hypothetical protein